jgi:ethanolaminephosphotransferase
MMTVAACASDLVSFFTFSQVKRGGGNITYFGDETWGKVFSPVFSHWDAVTSFDVLDTHIVDLNVTRNTVRELGHAHDWTMSIWHFLGVDHAGHVSGINSDLM